MTSAFDKWLTTQPEDPEDFVLTCLLVETYDAQERLINQNTLPLEDYPQLTARSHDTGEYQLECLVLKFRDGSEMIISRNEP